MTPDLLVRNISDTAMWAAAYRARETERPGALFRDPFAKRLAGARGEQIADKLTFKDSWAWVTRTYLFDRFVTAEVAAGADMIVNLAAGLDARPYRMALPERLAWVEIDLPDLLAYKEEILRNEKPACTVERIPLDLADRAARQTVFERLGQRAKSALILTEGLIIYLTAEEAGALGDDLVAASGLPPLGARPGLTGPSQDAAEEDGRGPRSRRGAPEVRAARRARLLRAAPLDAGRGRVARQNRRPAGPPLRVDADSRQAAGVERRPGLPPVGRRVPFQKGVSFG